MEPRAPKACILAVGTELTTGQITNRNAAWLSERLEALGAEVVLHETVPDDRAGIRQALERCALTGTLIFVTGGLGPTSDDFTRDVIAEWLGKELRYDEASWKRIQERLGRFGVAVAESNRQQCYFPEGAHVLLNPAGTANGFSARKAGIALWALPGPPREVEAVWRSGAEDELRSLLPPAPVRTLFTWQCLGKSEAALGELTESALSGSGLATGYRAHGAQVEVKVWIPGSDPAPYKPWFDRLEGAIGPWIATRQGEDLARRFIALLGSRDARVSDSATGGFLAERLGASLRNSATPQAARLEIRTDWGVPPALEESLEREAAISRDITIFRVQATQESPAEWQAGIARGGRVRSETFPWPLRGPEALDRSRRLVAELALKAGADWLEQWDSRNESGSS